MFNINNVKTGTYIKIKDGRVGYIESILYSEGSNEVSIFYKIQGVEKSYCYERPIEDLNKKFKQIGDYVFDDKIGILNYEDFSEIKEYSQSCMCRFFHDSEILSQEIRGGKDICKTVKHKDKMVINKINEIIKWINERG